MAERQFSLKTVLSVRDQLSPALKTARANVRTLNRSFKNLGSAASDLGSKLAAPLAALAGAGAFSIGKAVNDFISLGDSLDKASIRAGVSAKALQALRFAATGGGMSAEEMDGALVKLTTNMAKAARGENKNFVDLFKHLGISLKDSNGKVRSAADVMNNLAEAVHNNSDQAARAQIMTIAFGDKIGAKLIPVLEGGKQGLDEMTARAQQLGLIMSNADVKAAAHLGDSMDQLRQTVRGVSVSIGAKLAPVLEDIIGNIQECIAANREVIDQAIASVVNEVAGALKKIDWAAVITGIAETVRNVLGFIDAIGGAQTIAMGFAALMGGKLLVSVTNIASALFGVGKALFGLLGPWGVVAGVAVAAIVWIGKKVWENRDAIISAFNQVKEKVLGIWESIKSTVMGVIDAIIDKINVAKDLWKNRPRWLGGTGGDIPADAAGATASPMAAPPLEVNARQALTVHVIGENGARGRVTDAQGEGLSNLTVDYSYDGA